MELTTNQTTSNFLTANKEIKQRNKNKQTLISVKYLRIESTIFDLSQVIRGFHPKKISDKDFKYPSVSLSNDKEKQENIRTTIKLVKILEQFLNLPLNFFENLEEREIDLFFK